MTTMDQQQQVEGAAPPPPQVPQVALNVRCPTCPCAEPAGDDVGVAILYVLLFGTAIATLVNFGAAVSSPETCPSSNSQVSPRVWGIVHGSLLLSAALFGGILNLSCTNTGWVLRKSSWALLIGTILAVVGWIFYGFAIVTIYARECTKHGTVAVSMMVTLGFEFIITAGIYLVTGPH